MVLDDLKSDKTNTARTVIVSKEVLSDISLLREPQDDILNSGRC